MRYLLLSTILFLGFTACKQSVKGKNGVTYKSAIDYNDYIINRQTSLMKKVLDYSKISNDDLDSAEAVLKQSAKDAEKMIDEIKGMPAYKGDSSLRDAAIKSFTFYKHVFGKDYMDILNIRKKGEENITEEDVAAVDKIVETISKEEEVLDKVFHKAQQDFADRHKMKLITNKTQKEIEKEFDKLEKE
jgi:hypothetical protein